MKSCPSCGCEVSAVSRFCPICGAVLNDLVQQAYRQEEEPEPVCIPVPEDELPPAFEAQESYGRSVITAMRVITAVLSILIGLAGTAFGVYYIIKGLTVPALIWIFGGLVSAFLLFFILCILIIRYENISFIARHAEEQNRISLSQLELLRQLNERQAENTQLSQTMLALLRTMDGDRFDAFKQAEQQNATLEKLLKAQGECSDKLSRLRETDELLGKGALPCLKKTQTVGETIEQLVRECAAAVSSLPERLRGLFAPSAVPENEDADSNEGCAGAGETCADSDSPDNETDGSDDETVCEDNDGSDAEN